MSSADKPLLNIELEIANGVVKDVRIQMPPGLLDPDLVDLSEALLRMPFNSNLVSRFEKHLASMDQQQISAEKCQFLLKSIDAMIGKFV